MVEYIPEYDYSKNDYKALGKPFTNDMCGSCKSYYKKLFDKGVTKTEFPPICSGHVLEQVNSLKQSDFDSVDDFENAKLLMDPVAWAKLEFNWDHRWYQQSVSECTSRKKVLRGGRRCLAKGTSILTIQGPKNIEDIEVGDFVFGENGNPVRVREVFRNGIKKVGDFYTIGGEYIATCTPDHEWFTSEGMTKTKDMSDKVRLRMKNGKLSSDVPGEFLNLREEETFDLNVNSATNLYCLSNGVITHNSGKSRVEIILILHEMMTLPNRKILLLCPNDRLIGEFFDVIEEFINSSVSLTDSISRHIKNPYMLKLKNGSKLLGIAISPNDPKAGDKVRGLDADLFIIDEAETFKEPDLEAIMALLISNANTRVIVSSTPKPWKKNFYKTCSNKDLGYKEFWWISAEKPDWTEEMENQLKDEFSSDAYMSEFNADFSDTAEGVFKKKFIDPSLRDYDIDKSSPRPGGTYILGVDWNKSAGHHMLILEVDGRFLKVVFKKVTPQSEYMHTQAVEDIIALHKIWNFKYVFADGGYGHTSIELLKKYGSENKLTGLANIVHGVLMNESIEIKSPINGKIIKKRAKPYLVDHTVKLLEDGCLILPESEDYSDIGEGTRDVGLVAQMRNFYIKGYSVYNYPTYSQGDDHTLTAFILACGMWVNLEGPLKQLPYSSRILNLPTHIKKDIELSKSEEEMLKDLRKYKLISSTGKVNPVKKPPSVRDLDTSMRSLGGRRNISNIPFTGKNKGIRRKTF